MSRRAECSVTVDVVIFAMDRDKLHVLLVKRRIDPFLGSWAIPGGFVLASESLEDAARRELLEETGVKQVYLEQLYTFGDVGRDPRGRVVTVAYFSLLREISEAKGGSDASEARWIALDQRPSLAFDHSKILSYALHRLRGKLAYTDIGFRLVGETFTLSQLQRVHEAVLGKNLDKRNFRKKMEEQRSLKPLKKWTTDGKGRPAQLFKYVSLGTKQEK